MAAGRSCAALLFAIAVLLVGCGEDDEGSVDVKGQGTDTAGKTSTGGSAAPSGPSVAKVKVGETEYTLDPANPKVPKTGVVTFEVSNNGKITHALEVEGPDGEAKTDPIEPGATATLKVDFKRAGDFTWYCPIADHKQRGMTGKVEVAGGGEAGSDAHGNGGY